MKQMIAKEIDAAWPKKTISAKDRAKQLEKLRAEKRQLEAMKSSSFANWNQRG
jgi:hypothetical protein